MLWKKESTAPQGTDNRLDYFIEHAPIAIAHVDQDSFILETNNAFNALFRNTISVSSPIKLLSLLDDDDQKLVSVRLACTGKGQVQGDGIELNVNLPNGEKIFCADVYFATAIGGFQRTAYYAAYD